MYSVAIQAGGASSRMGQDKALLPFLGETLLARVMNRISPLGDEVLVTTNHPERFTDFGVSLVRDELPGKGALGGLYTALRAARYPLVIVVACDMPFVNAEILAEACDRILANEVDVLIPFTNEGYEPFHAVYRRDTCLPAVYAALQAGERRLISWFPQVEVLTLSGDEMLRYDPHQLAFWNVNTPDDLHRAEELAVELAGKDQSRTDQ
jgi:molybdopterin-guanine dinucleotide biosynthesis protein A